MSYSRSVKSPRSLQGKTVELVRDIKHALSDDVIPSGLKGRVDWDEGGDEVVVEFEREVPDTGYKLANHNQAWVARTYLRVIE